MLYTSKRRNVVRKSSAKVQCVTLSQDNYMYNYMEYFNMIGQWRIYIVKFWTRAPPGGPKFFQFHAVFGKIWLNCMLAPPWRVGAPSSGKSWIRHCWHMYIIYMSFTTVQISIRLILLH